MRVIPVEQRSATEPAGKAEPFARERSPRRRGETANSLAAKTQTPVGDGASAPEPPPAEIAFLLAQGVPAVVLHYAATLARRQGVTADAALLAEGLVEEEVFYRALAKCLDVPFLDLAADPELGGETAENAARGYAPIADDPDGLNWLMAPVGPQIARLVGAARVSRGRPLFMVTTRSRFLALLRQRCAATLAWDASYCAELVDPDLCVRGKLDRRALFAAAALVALSLIALLGPSVCAARVAGLLLAPAFLAASALRLAACAASRARREAPAEIDDDDAPFYTVAIALYREARVVGQLTRALDKLDYPRAKLDIKFVVEADDAETLVALRAHPPRAPHEIIVAPEGGPRTKPRALNMAAPFAKGALLAVFDAEDLPQPRQLRAAAALFAQAPPEVACLQASLAIDNGGRNAMTALFALDYAGLFDAYNKGLAQLRLPLFLGGTSNHFRLEALRRVGFWDACNVTEDADLGLRLARAGFRIETFASETFEEAPESLTTLLKQRSRWIKGWMQTALVHCRSPRRYFLELGPRAGIGVAAMFAGGVLAPLLGPALFIGFLREACFGSLLRPTTPIEAGFAALACFVAIAGAAAVVWPLLLGMQRRRLTHYWPALFALPFWLLFLSAAAWRAAFELWRRPFHWDKTEHGLTTGRNRAEARIYAEPPAISLPQPQRTV